MGRKPIGDKAMTAAERQRRRRAKRHEKMPAPRHEMPSPAPPPSAPLVIHGTAPPAAPTLVIRGPVVRPPPAPAPEKRKHFTLADLERAERGLPINRRPEPAAPAKQRGRPRRSRGFWNEKNQGV